METVNFDLIATLLYLSVALYIASMTAYIFFLIKPNDLFLTDKKENIEKYAFFFMSAGFFIHFVIIVYKSFKIGTIPLNNIEQALSIAALALAGGFRIFKKHFNINTVGIFVSPLVVFLMVAMLLISKSISTSSSFMQGFWLVSHLVLIIIGQIVFVLASVAGVLYIIKKHNRVLIESIPLDILDSANYVFIAVGYVMIIFGLITGFIYAKVAWGDLWSWSPGVVWAMVTWIIYSILLYLRLNFGWKGTRSAVITNICFWLLFISFLGVSTLL